MCVCVCVCVCVYVCVFLPQCVALCTEPRPSLALVSHRSVGGTGTSHLNLTAGKVTNQTTGSTHHPLQQPITTQRGKGTIVRVISAVLRVIIIVIIIISVIVIVIFLVCSLIDLV